MQPRKPGSRDSSRSPNNGEGGSITECRPDSIIITRVHGYLNASVVTKMHGDIVPLIRQDTLRTWLVDTTEVSGFDALGIPGPAGTFLRDLKSRKFMVVGIITSDAVRMMTSTLCLAANIRQRFYRTAFEAETFIKEFREESQNA